MRAPFSHSGGGWQLLRLMFTFFVIARFLTRHRVSFTIIYVRRFGMFSPRTVARIKRIMEHPWTEPLFDALVLVQALLLIVQLVLEQAGSHASAVRTPAPPVIGVVADALWAIVALFIVEIGAKVVAWGFRGFWARSAFNRFDFVVVFGSVVVAVVVGALGGQDTVARSKNGAEYVRLLKLVRLARTLRCVFFLSFFSSYPMHLR